VCLSYVSGSTTKGGDPVVVARVYGLYQSKEPVSHLWRVSVRQRVTGSSDDAAAAEMDTRLESEMLQGHDEDPHVIAASAPRSAFDSVGAGTGSFVSFPSSSSSSLPSLSASVSASAASASAPVATASTSSSSSRKRSSSKLGAATQARMSSRNVKAAHGSRGSDRPSPATPTGSHLGLAEGDDDEDDYHITLEPTEHASPTRSVKSASGALVRSFHYRSRASSSSSASALLHPTNIAASSAASVRSEAEVDPSRPNSSSLSQRGRVPSLAHRTQPHSHISQRRDSDYSVLSLSESHSHFSESSWSMSRSLEASGSISQSAIRNVHNKENNIPRGSSAFTSTIPSKVFEAHGLENMLGEDEDSGAHAQAQAAAARVQPRSNFSGAFDGLSGVHSASTRRNSVSGHMAARTISLWRPVREESDYNSDGDEDDSSIALTAAVGAVMYDQSDTRDTVMSALTVGSYASGRNTPRHEAAVGALTASFAGHGVGARTPLSQTQRRYTGTDDDIAAEIDALEAENSHMSAPPSASRRTISRSRRVSLHKPSTPSSSASNTTPRTPHSAGRRTANSARAVLRASAPPLLDFGSEPQLLARPTPLAASDQMSFLSFAPKELPALLDAGDSSSGRSSPSLGPSAAPLTVDTSIAPANYLRAAEHGHGQVDLFAHFSDMIDADTATIADTQLTSRSSRGQEGEGEGEGERDGGVRGRISVHEEAALPKTSSISSFLDLSTSFSPRHGFSVPTAQLQWQGMTDGSILVPQLDTAASPAHASHASRLDTSFLGFSAV
jgi:hypothetical protein